VRDSKVLNDVFPGQALRFAPEEKGRFKALSVKEWGKRFMAAPVDFGGLAELQGVKH